MSKGKAAVLIIDDEEEIRESIELLLNSEGLATDIAVDGEECVAPLTGGMSVTVEGPQHLPRWRRPRQLGGEGRDPVFSLDSIDLSQSLAYLTRSNSHRSYQTPARIDHAGLNGSTLPCVGSCAPTHFAVDIR